MQKDLDSHDGVYPIFGASGLIKTVDFYEQEKPYIAIIKDGAGIGKVMKLPAQSSVIGTLQYIIPNDNINIDYLAFALEYMKLEKYNFGAAIPHIYFRDYQNEEIMNLSLSQQNIIANNLCLVRNNIYLRKKQLQKLDELIKSRFIEMFGTFDLSRIKENWISISNIGKVIGGSTPKTEKSEFWNGEFRWITPAELDNDSGYIFDSMRKITEAGVRSCSLIKLPKDTVLFTSRAPIGKVAIAGNSFYCNQGFKNIVCSEKVNPKFLYALLLYNVNYLNSLGRGATFKELSKSMVEKIKIPVPPIELQNEFAAFVEKVDKTKTAVRQSLEKLEILKKSLMQKYFG